MNAESYSAVERLARRLPFHLDDFDRVNRLFDQYESGGNRDAEIQLELWTYCFVRRYLTIKLSRDPLVGAADLEELLDRVYRRIRSGRRGVRARYASWVSVVCRNSYLNYVRDRRATRYISEDPRSRDDLLEVESVAGHIDLGTALGVVHNAIARLPSYLQQIARMRVLEELPYEEISLLVDRPIETVRAYAHKAVVRLRSDPSVCAALERPAPPEGRRPQAESAAGPRENDA